MCLFLAAISHEIGQQDLQTDCFLLNPEGIHVHRRLNLAKNNGPNWLLNIIIDISSVTTETTCWSRKEFLLQGVD